MPENEKSIGRDVRFCPFCFQMTFEMSEVSGNQVFCEVCGVDIEVKDLVKQ
jgi:hypothetical protein